MPDIGVIPDLNRRLDAVARHIGKRLKRRAVGLFALGFCWVAIGTLEFYLHRTVEPLETPVLLWALGVATLGVVSGFYLGSSQRGPDYEADVLDIYRDALQARAEALALRNALLREQAELQSRRTDQPQVFTAVQSADPGPIDT